MVSQIMKIFICIVTVNMVCGRTVLSKDDMKQYGVSFYDPKTGNPVMGEFVTLEEYYNGNATDMPGLATLGGNGLSCECKDLTCSCCAGIKIDSLKLDKKACSKFTLNPKDLDMKMILEWNAREIFNKQVSLKNPPPLCLSIPNVPSLKFCIRADTSTVKNNLRVCIGFEARFAATGILKVNFKCVELGADGFHWNVQSYGNAIPFSLETAPANTYHEVILEEVDLLPGPVQPLISNNDAEEYEVSFYDPKTGNPVMGEFVTIAEYHNSNATDMPGLATLGGADLSCECKDFTCSCCAGIKINAFHLDKKACLKFTYDPNALGIIVSVLWNDREVFSKEISARNPPPICLSLPDVPLLKFCIRFSDVSLVDRNLHTCINFEVKILFKRIWNVRFKCVDIGADGFHWNKTAFAYAVSSKPMTEELVPYEVVILEEADL